MGAELLQDLSPAQIEVVTTDAAPLAVLAGPGSGKTRVLSRRVAWRCRVVDPAHVLVLTFSRRAATELEDRLHRLGLPTGARRAGVVAGTFHAVAWAAVARHRAERGREPPAILGRPARLLTPALEAALGRRPWPSEVSSFSAELAWARRQAAGPGDYARLRPASD